MATTEPRCPVCDRVMKPLWGAKFFCPADCDRARPEEAEITFDFSFDEEEPTQPLGLAGQTVSAMQCPKCGSHNTATLRGTLSHCWDCGRVW